MANFNFNKVIIGGRLTADPELKTTPSGVSVTTFTVAVNRLSRKSDKPAADFFTVTAWRETAEFITRYFRKADTTCIEGRLEVRSWTDQTGAKRHATEIVAERALFVDSKSDKSYTPASPALAEVGEDEDLPF